LAFFKGADGEDKLKLLYLYGKKFYSYSKPKSNFNSTFSSYFTLNETEYEKRKQIGVNNFLKGTKSDKLSKDKIARDKLIKYLYERKKELDLTQEKIAEIAGIDRTTVINSLKIDKKEGILK
jgi:hypothetical protein